MTRVGLRFAKTDAHRLQRLAAQVRAGEIPNAHASVFDNAAQAATTGEPLIIICRDKAEALLMADGFTLYGVGRPTIDELAGYVSAN